MNSDGKLVRSWMGAGGIVFARSSVRHEGRRALDSARGRTLACRVQLSCRQESTPVSRTRSLLALCRVDGDGASCPRTASCLSAQLHALMQSNAKASRRISRARACSLLSDSSRCALERGGAVLAGKRLRDPVAYKRQSMPKPALKDEMKRLTPSEMVDRGGDDDDDGVRKLLEARGPAPAPTLQQQRRQETLLESAATACSRPVAAVSRALLSPRGEQVPSGEDDPRVPRLDTCPDSRA